MKKKILLSAVAVIVAVITAMGYGVVSQNSQSDQYSKTCYACKGLGWCQICDGSGKTYTFGLEGICGACKGTGTCSSCGGTGQK